MTAPSLPLSRARRHPWRVAAGALFLLVLLAAGTMAALHRRGESSAPVAAEKAPAAHAEAISPSMLRVAVVKTEPLPLHEPLPAHLGYDEDHTARVLPAWNGRIARIDVSVGDAVKAGQSLALVDSTDYGSALADLDKARADLALKQKASERARSLLDAQVIARKDAEQADADLAQAQAEAQRARWRLSNLLPRGQAAQGEHIPLTSPLAGWVTERTASPGQELGTAAGAPLFVVSDLHRLWLTIDLPEHLLGHVQIGAPVRLSVDAWPGQVFTARVDRIAPVIDPATRRVQVRAVVDNHDLRLKPEMYAQVAMPRPDGAQGVAVPNGALVSQGYDTLLYVQKAPGVYEPRTVQVGLHGASTSWVTDGVHDGETVVVQGALLLGTQLAADGDRTGQAIR